MPGYETGKTFYSYDPAKAKQLLAQAGFPNGFSTTLYTHNVDPFPKVAQALQADLKAVGINASIKQMDRATYWNKIEVQSSTIRHGAHGLVHGLPGPQRLDRPALQQGPAVDGGSTWAGGGTRRSTAYTASASVLDPAKRIAMYKQMQDIIMSRRPRCRCTSRSTPACAARTRAASHPAGVDLRLPGLLEDERQVNRGGTQRLMQTRPGGKRAGAGAQRAPAPACRPGPPGEQGRHG